MNKASWGFFRGVCKTSRNQSIFLHCGYELLSLNEKSYVKTCLHDEGKDHLAISTYVIQNTQGCSQHEADEALASFVFTVTWVSEVGILVYRE